MPQHTSSVPAPGAPVPVEGSILVRVRYCECDPMGVAHHAAYAPWLEMGRTELLRDTGVTYAQLETSGVFLVVTQLQLRFRRPVYYDDLLRIRTRVVGASRVKINHEYEVILAEDGKHAGSSAVRNAGDVLAVASTTLACVGRDGKVRPLPDWLAGTDAA